MRFSAEVIEKANKYSKKYFLCRMLFSAVFAIIFYLSVTNLSAVFFAPILFLYFSVSIISSRLIFRKCILSLVNKELDAETYLAIIYNKTIDTAAATWQLLGEYFCGNYNNVIEICNDRLSNPKIAKKYKYYYYAYLANVYFEIGDDENLRLVCEQYYSSMSGEKARKQKKLAIRLKRMGLYQDYLNKNFEFCLEWVNVNDPLVINQHHRTFCKARFALIQGNQNEARGYLESLVKSVPNLNYGKLARKILEKLDNPEENSDFARLTDFVNPSASVDVTLCTAKASKLRQNFFKVCVCCLVIMGILVSGMAINFEFKNAAYRESLRVVVEADFDGVEVLDDIAPEYYGEIVDALFIFRTDEELAIGCAYKYDGDDTMRYEVMAGIPLSALTNDVSPAMNFHAVTSDYLIRCHFYTDESDIPDIYRYKSSFEVDGKTVYFVIINIVSETQVM